jgi:hypothetical protein
MRGLDFITPCQVCNRARQFHASRAMISPSRQIELTHRRSHQTLAFIPSTALRAGLQVAELPDLPDTDIRITENRVFGINFRAPRSLDVSCSLDTRTN